MLAGLIVGAVDIIVNEIRELKKQWKRNESRKKEPKIRFLFGNHLSGSFIMSVAKEFTTDRNTDVKTAGNRVIEGCNSLLVAYTRDSFKVRAGLPTENKNAVSLAGVEIIVLEGGVIRVPAAIRGHATFGFLISGRLPV